MLHLAYMGESKKIKTEDKKYLIVRKPLSIPNGYIHIPALSPSIELFNKTMRWKINEFTKEELKILFSNGITNNGSNAWWFFYEKEFQNEIQFRKDMRCEISKVEKFLCEGNDLWLFCYCKDVYRCHRYLLGKYFKSREFEVDFRILKPVEKEEYQFELKL